MDALFGSNALAGPVGKEVERATDEMLLGPDWSINLDLVDMVKSRTDGPKSVCLAVRKRIKDGSPKQALLALTVIETCVKNCSFNVHNEVAQKEFMTVMCEVARGSKGREAQTQALALIQQWGIAFHSKREALPLFADSYAQLQREGAHFPPVDDSMAPVFTPPPTGMQPSANGASGGAAATAASGGGPSTEDELAKLREDLGTVAEKIALCREMLPHSPGIANDDALAEIVGFLEACKPRMDALVEAGLQGVLDEDMLAHCLKLGTDLQATLDAEKSGTPIEALQTAGAPGAAAAGGAASTPTLLDFGTDGGDDDEEEEEGLSRAGGRKTLGAKKLPPPIAPAPAAAVLPPPAAAPAAEPSLLDFTEPTPTPAPTPSAGPATGAAPFDPFAPPAPVVDVPAATMAPGVVNVGAATPMAAAPGIMSVPAMPVPAPAMAPPVPVVQTMPPMMATPAAPAMAMTAPAMTMPLPPPPAAPGMPGMPPAVMPPPVPMVPAPAPAAAQQGDDFDEFLKARAAK